MQFENEPAARLLVGPGGTGKTRLAVELCRHLTERGWRAGFASDREATDDLVKMVHALAERALIVVDFAETRGYRLNVWLADLGIRENRSSVRMLLLARAAGEWWEELQRDSVEAGIEQVLSNILPEPLAPVAETTLDRVDAFETAASAFAQVQGMKPSAVPPPDLSGAGFESILSVHMAALEAVGVPEKPGTDSGNTTDNSVVSKVLYMEERYWALSAKARGLRHSARVLERAGAIATLLGASDEDEASTVLKRVVDLADTSEEERRDLAHWYHDLYPGAEWFPALQPDTLAEELAARVLLAYPGMARSAFRQLDAVRAHRALTILNRAAQHRTDFDTVLAEALVSDLKSLASPATAVAVQTGDPIGPLLGGILDQRPEQREAVAHELAREYERIAGEMLRGGPRTARMTAIVTRTRALSRWAHYTPSEVDDLFGASTDGDRIVALGVAMTRPASSNFGLVLEAIVGSRSAFEQYCALSTAWNMLPILDASMKERLGAALTSSEGNVKFIATATARRSIMAGILTSLGRPLPPYISPQRWAIKSLADPDMRRVPGEVSVSATVEQLRALVRPHTIDQAAPPDRRQAPVEWTIYKVTAVLVGAKVEFFDYSAGIQLVIADPTDGTASIIVGFPAPSLISFLSTSDPALFDRLAKAREAVLAASPPELRQIAGGGWLPTGVPLEDINPQTGAARVYPLEGLAEIVGIGFFGTNTHDGGAPNGIELYPVLSFSLISPPPQR